jgi:ABC-type nitrate/sulfonate/bicarbonate transport system substrate-binding protein
VDLAELDITYPLQVVITTRAFLQTNRPLLKRFLKGFANALHHYRSDSQAGINFQIKQFKLNREDAEIGYRYSAKVLDFNLTSVNACASFAFFEFERGCLIDSSSLHRRQRPAARNFLE